MISRRSVLSCPAGLLLDLVLLFSAFPAGGQIVNRLRVDPETFQIYAGARMQQFSPDNLPLADSLCSAGLRTGNWKLRCLGRSLEFPVRFATGEYELMDAAVAEIKELTAWRKGGARSFYYAALHEYCEYLVQLGRSSDAMLEARAMERLALEDHKPLGRAYSYRIIGLIQSYRSNSWLAIRNLQDAAKYSEEAGLEQDLPNLYILIAREYIRMHDFTRSAAFCEKAAVYQEYFPSLRIKVLMTRALQFYEQGDIASFRACYEELQADPLYAYQADSDARCRMDICYLLTRQMFDDALEKADLLSTPMRRYDIKHGIYAAKGDYTDAYGQLGLLMVEKDSVYIKVQNEDLDVLDAEMNNARLREDAQRLKAQNQMTIMIGFLVMFALAFLAILFNQWQLRQSLDEMRRKNSQALAARRAFQKAMEARENENAYKIKLLQNRTTNVFTGYEDLLSD